MSVAGFFRLTPTDARRNLGEVAVAVGTWRHVAAEWLPADEVEAMAPAFAEVETARAVH